MKIAILGNQARAMANFWSVFIRALVSAGHEVVCITPVEDTDWNNVLSGLGARLAHYPLDRKGLNPIRDMKTLLGLRRVFRSERPDFLFAFTIKPVIYGALASALAGFPKKKGRTVMITGLGYMFEADSFVKRMLMYVAALLYRAAFSQAATVFFQNSDDKALFARLSIVPKGMRVEMSPGTGVDSSLFTVASQPSLPITFLLIGRLLEAKGLYEYYNAAKMLKTRYPDARFQLLGPAEQGVGSVPLDTVQKWHTEGVVEYLGETRDVRPYFAAAHVLVLPSYREGTPTVVLEAMSMGRAAVVTDVPGCRETVAHDQNGTIVQAHDVASLAAGMERYILDPALAAMHGARGRERAETEFDARNVAVHIANVMGIPL